MPRAEVVLMCMGLAIAFLLASILIVAIHTAYNPYADPCAEFSYSEQHCERSGMLTLAGIVAALSSVFILFLVMPERGPPSEPTHEPKR